MMTDNRVSSISPEFLNDVTDLTNLRREFGPFKGRFIWNASSKWLEQLSEVVETDPNTTEMQLQKARGVLEAFKQEGYLLDINYGLLNEDEWLQATNKAIEKGATFEFIVHPHEKKEPTSSIAWNDLFDNLADPLTQKTSWEIKGSLFEYREALTPLTLNANALYLIDPYLNPLKTPHGGLDLLLEVVSLAKNSKRCFEIHLLTTSSGLPKDFQPTESTFAVFQEQLKAEFSSKLRGGMKLMWHLLWDDSKSRSRSSDYFGMHDRFFLTDKGGLELSKGFFVRDPQNKRDEVLNIRYLEASSYKDKFERYVRRLTTTSGTQNRIGNRRIERFLVMPDA